MFSISPMAAGVITHPAVVGNDLYHAPFYSLRELIINRTESPMCTLQALCISHLGIAASIAACSPSASHSQFCLGAEEWLILLICVNRLTWPYRSAVILWEELGGELERAFSVTHHPAWRENAVKDAGTAIDGTALGLEPTQVSDETFPMTVFTANPLLSTRLYNYTLLQLCKEVTFQKGLLISHS